MEGIVYKCWGINIFFGYGNDYIDFINLVCGINLVVDLGVNIIYCVVCCFN